MDIRLQAGCKRGLCNSVCVCVCVCVTVFRRGSGGVCATVFRRGWGGGFVGFRWAGRRVSSAVYGPNTLTLKSPALCACSFSQQALGSSDCVPPLPLLLLLRLLLALQLLQLLVALLLLLLLLLSALKKADGTFAPAHILADGRLEGQAEPHKRCSSMAVRAPPQTSSSSSSCNASGCTGDSGCKQQQQGQRQQGQARAHL